MDIKRIEAELLKNPFNFDLRLKYANLLLELERYEDSLQQFLILDNGTHSTVELKLKICDLYMNQGDQDNARKYYKEAKAMGLPDDFEEFDELEEIQSAQPSIKPPKPVFFSEIIGMDSLKKTVRLKIIEPFKNVGLFQKFKKDAGGGVLLYGPPGCGKTMLAKAIATECNAEFFSIELSDILNLWIGESERNLAAAFDRARSSTPSVLFIDELDALAYSRSKTQNESSRKLVNEFLTQLDGISANNQGMLILGATNMPWDVDSAMKRPGRFSRVIFVPPPDEAARAALFESKLEGVPKKGIQYSLLASQSPHFSGADIDGVIEFAKENVISDILESGKEREIETSDLILGIKERAPSTMDWLKTAKNLVKFGDPDGQYKDVKVYLKESKMY
ncbi:AAA family ATPase [Leptospira idonii]|uniref:ATP-binding protein n=1 Tax=Leptospira idonii TaxID=1193500 RepID=A0A4R9LYI6_9LEPT|nr:AAA family ATPase [Leptospira idonii]TGN17651.1 ATP-binding protein [Leptospira idonii]